MTGKFIRRRVIGLASIVSVALLGGAPAMANDAGCSGSISGRMWEDLNGDGCQDAFEPGIPDVRIRIFADCEDPVFVDMTTTDGDGGYEFTGLCGGDYVVAADPMTLPPGTSSSPLNACGNDDLDSDCFEGKVCVHLSGDDDVKDNVDCGFVPDCVGVIGDFIWEDRDGDGVQDDDEPGIPGVRLVLLFGCGDDFVYAETETDQDGRYTFEGLCSGMYLVVVDESTVPDGYVPSPPDQGGDDERDSDCIDGVVCVDLPADDSMDLSIDCGFVPPPVLGDDCCENGKPRTLTFRYTGDDCSATSHEQDDGKVSCEDFGTLPDTVRILSTDKEDPNDDGARVWFDGVVTLNQSFTADAVNAGEDKLTNETFIHILDLSGNLLQSVEFHTSCSQPLVTGNQFGASLLVGCVGEDEPIEGDCCENGKPRVLTMQYTGDDCSATSHAQDDGKVNCDDFGTLPDTVRILSTDKEDPEDDGARVWFDGEVTVGETYDIDASNAGETKLQNETFIHIFDLGGNLLQSSEFHTSCSQPLFVGNQFGASLLVDCIGEDEPVEGDCCENGNPRVLTMQYTGDDCSATSHAQDPSKVNCDDFGTLPDTVRILSTDKENPDDGGARVWFDGEVTVGETYDIDAANAGETKLQNETFIHIFDLSGNLLQSSEFHTSCSQPLFVGNQFGASLLVDCTSENEAVTGDCCENGKPRILTMQYTGDDCSATSHLQDPGKVSCDDFGTLVDAVKILATDDDNAEASDPKVWFDGEVSFNGLFDLDAGNEGQSSFPSETFIHIFDMDGNLLQSVEFHTSCSQPLFIGNQFGASLLVACTGEDEPTSCVGDLNGDGVVDTSDLLLVLGAWGTDDPSGDVIPDGIVDTNDLLVLLGNWGPC